MVKKKKTQQKIYKLTFDNPMNVTFCDGKVHAGNAVEMLDCIQYKMDMSELIHPNENLYCVEVVGDSMRGVGIFDGDYAIFDPDRTVVDGNIVVASIDEECTVKIFHKDEEGNIRLEPTNKRYKTYYLNEGSGVNAIVMGVVVRAVKKSFV